MKILIVDLDTEWRGGQNQALLMLEGFNARHHVAELVTPKVPLLVNAPPPAASPFTPFRAAPRALSAALKIAELLRSSSPDPELHADDRQICSRPRQ